MTESEAKDSATNPSEMAAQNSGQPSEDETIRAMSPMTLRCAPTSSA